MKTVTIKIGDEDLKMLGQIFQDEPNFQPQNAQDHLIVEILKQVLNNPKTDIIIVE
jgi:hypothetical protein